MTWRRLLFGGLGLACLVAALVTGHPAPDRVAAAVALLGNDYLLVAAIGGVGLLAAVVAAVSGRSRNLVQAELPSPERPAQVPSPGTEFDDALDSWRTWLPVAGRDARADLHARLREDAVETLRRTAGWDRETAERRVADADWPADPAVAAFLAPAEPPSPPVVGGLLALLGGETWFRRQVRRSAVAIVDLDATAGETDADDRAVAGAERDRP